MGQGAAPFASQAFLLAVLSGIRLDSLYGLVNKIVDGVAPAMPPSLFEDLEPISFKAMAVVKDLLNFSTGGLNR